MMAVITASGCSSISQWPELAMLSARTLLGGEADLVREADPEAFLAADRQHRHGELALRQELLVVRSILAERCELRERIVDRVRARIERRVMLARRLVDVLRISRQLVVKTVEVNALASGDQPLLVGAEEIEMPGVPVLDHLVPVAEPGQRGVHHHPAGDAVAVLRGERVADHVADIVGHQRDGSADAELLEHRGHVPGLALLVVPGLGMRREAHAAKIGHDDRVILDQPSGERRPHVPAVAEPVEQQDRRALAPHTHVDDRSRDRDFLGVERRRKRLHGRSGRGERQRRHHQRNSTQRRNHS